MQTDVTGENMHILTERLWEDYKIGKKDKENYEKESFEAGIHMAVSFLLNSLK